MNYAFKMIFLTITLLPIFSFSSELRDSTAQELDNIFFSKSVMDTTKVQFDFTNFEEIMKYMGWFFNLHASHQKYVVNILKHQIAIRESKALEIFSIDELKAYAVYLQELLQDKLKEHVLLLANRKNASTFLAHSLVVMLFSAALLAHGMKAKIGVASVAAVLAAYKAFDAMGLQDKDITATLTENLYEETMAFIYETIEKRSKKLS